VIRTNDRRLHGVQWLADWWDGVELWITQLWFPFQVLLVIVVLLPLCWAVALLIDRGVDRASAVLSPRRRRP
jgi:hypothetical protein